MPSGSCATRASLLAVFACGNGAFSSTNPDGSTQLDVTYSADTVCLFTAVQTP
jgi:hypothetical protein